MTGSFSISASSTDTSICGSDANSVFRLPTGVPLPNRFLMSLISLGDPVPLLVVRAQQFDQRLALLRQFPVLGLDLDLFELAQRPQPHIEDRLGLHIGQVEPRDHHGLRLILVADDADHLVEIEIGDQASRRALRAGARSASAGARSGGAAPPCGDRATPAAPARGPAPAGSAPSTAPSC